jgi:hypothetical protein
MKAVIAPMLKPLIARKAAEHYKLRQHLLTDVGVKDLWPHYFQIPADMRVQCGWEGCEPCE